MFGFVLFALILTVVILLIPTSKKKKKMEEVEKAKPKVRYESYYVWLMDAQNNVDRYENYYKRFYEENDDYFLPAKELKENCYYDEKVYKFEPYELPLKMENRDVYSYIEEGEWEKIGRVKKTADINGKLKLYIFPNIYKYVTESHVEKESDDSYFGIEVSRYVNVEEEPGI